MGLLSGTPSVTFWAVPWNPYPGTVIWSPTSPTPETFIWTPPPPREFYLALLN